MNKKTSQHEIVFKLKSFQTFNHYYMKIIKQSLKNM